MNMKGGSEFGESEFLLFANKLKELTYNTYLVLNYDDEKYKEALTKYKTYIKEDLLESYGKKDKFNDLNKMVVEAVIDDNYQDVAGSGSDELYDFTGLTEKVLKKIGINYVLTSEELVAIRSVLESSDSSSSSSSNSPVSSRGSKNKKNKSKKKKKKKITKSKKRKRRSKKTNKR